MLVHPPIEIVVTIVSNPSLIVQRTTITLKDEVFPRISDLFAEVGTICNQQPFRIYCRIAERDYVPIFNFISLVGGLKLTFSHAIYVVMDEAIIVSTRADSMSFRNMQHRRASGEVVIGSISDYGSDVGEEELSSVVLSDIELLQCALLVFKRRSDNLGAAFRYLFVKTPTLHGSELRDVARQTNILRKGESREAICPIDYVHGARRNVIINVEFPAKPKGAVFFP
ncbi:uncharacterized protein LOC117223718 isoform X1 [Megalopta genalis]|uniref:uncharacterized protein LOC117223718 isoform X1 n=1 Tax=Megalopta genalis TaxID=115081 RepID=UPI003FD291DA